jgi:PPM family protein phosphatase
VTSPLDAPTSVGQAGGEDVGVHVRVHAATHVGAVRTSNEDHFGATAIAAPTPDGAVISVDVRQREFMAVVADGLGGRPRGDVASRMAVDCLLRVVPASPADFESSFHRADAEIHAAMDGLLDAAGMATTAAAVVVRSEGIMVANVGDSQVLEYQDGRLRLLSTDDVPADGAHLPGLPGAGVTQALGGAPGSVIRPHLYRDDLGSSRRILLATDGLTSYVPRAEIADVLRENRGVDAIHRLLRLAELSGGRDNVTVVLVEAIDVGQ